MASNQSQKGTQGTKRTEGTGESSKGKQSLKSLPSFESLKSSSKSGGFIPPHGGYQNLLSYQKSEIVFDATVRFVERFLSKRDRTCDQMIQAARSGKQNIAEGSMASGTSKEMEIKLTSVARASLEELRVDYLDFLRLRGLEPWPPDHRYAKKLRALVRQPGNTYETFRKGIEHEDPVICANVILGLISVTSFLLQRQLKHLEEDFVNHGGIRERMTQARLARRAH